MVPDEEFQRTLVIREQFPVVRRNRSPNLDHDPEESIDRSGVLRTVFSQFEESRCERPPGPSPIPPLQIDRRDAALLDVKAIVLIGPRPPGCLILLEQHLKLGPGCLRFRLLSEKRWSAEQEHDHHAAQGTPPIGPVDLGQSLACLLSTIVIGISQRVDDRAAPPVKCIPRLSEFQPQVCGTYGRVLGEMWPLRE